MAPPLRLDLPTGHHLRPLREDLRRHGAEFDAGVAFAFAVLDEAETELVGCVYIDPRRGGPERDAVASWWVIDREADGPLDRTLGEVLPGWLRDAFGLEAIDWV